MFIVFFAFVFSCGRTLLFIDGGTLLFCSRNTLAIISGGTYWSGCWMTVVSWGTEGNTKDAR